MPRGMTGFAQMVFKAIQNYGVVVTDQTRGVSLQAETSNDWAYDGNSGTDPITASWDSDPAYAALDGMPWSQLEVLNPGQQPSNARHPVVPAITSANSVGAIVGEPFSFTITTTGTPTPKIKVLGRLPKGLSFVDNQNGTATISGTMTRLGKKQDSRLITRTIRATFGTGDTAQVQSQVLGIRLFR